MNIVYEVTNICMHYCVYICVCVFKSVTLLSEKVSISSSSTFSLTQDDIFDTFNCYYLTLFKKCRIHLFVDIASYRAPITEH